MVMFALWVLVALGVSGQDPMPSRTAASVQTLPTFAALATANRQTELTVRWVVTAAAADTLVAPGSLPEVNRFEIVRRAATVEAPVRERNPQIGPDELVVVAVDAQGRDVGWQRVKDPRTVRSEQPGRGGLLSGQTFHRSETELVIRVPDGAAVAAVRVYEARWNGREWLLRGLGTISLF